MKLLKGLLVFALLVAAALLAIGFALPDSARVERSISIAAPPATVFTVLEGFHQFNRWSPWADLDPGTVYSFSGPPLGVGARSAWSSGDADVGSGEQQVLEAVPYSSVRVRLRFGGMDLDTQLIYTLAPEGEGTRVNWTYQADFHGDLVNRYFGLALDHMIGPDFDKGLGRLRSFCESLPHLDFTPARPAVVEIQAQPLAFISTEAPIDGARAVADAAYARLGQYLDAVGRTAIGAPMLITRDFDESTHIWKFDAALPIDRPCTPPSENDDIKCGLSDAGWAVRAEHSGPAAGLDQSWAALDAFQTVAGLADNGSSWEQPAADGGDDASSLKTLLFAPVK